MCQEDCVFKVRSRCMASPRPLWLPYKAQASQKRKFCMGSEYNFCINKKENNSLYFAHFCSLLPPPLPPHLPSPRIFENGFHTRVHTAWNLLCHLGWPQVCGDCPCLQSIGTASLQAPCLVSFPFVTQFFLAIKDRVFVMSLLVTRGRNPTHTGVCQKGKPGGNCDHGSMKTRDLRFFFLNQNSFFFHFSALFFSLLILF